MRVICILLIVLGLGLCLVHFICPHTITVQEVRQVPYTEQVPYQETVTREQILHTESYVVIPGQYYVALPPNGTYINAGKNLTLSWWASDNITALILEIGMFKHFEAIPLYPPPELEAIGSGRAGSISAAIKINNVYYSVLANFSPTPLTLVGSEAKITWQETVTKFRNETRYRTEYIPKEVNSNLYLYSGLAIIGIGVAYAIWKGKSQRAWLCLRRKFQIEGSL